MDRTDILLKMVVETILEEEGSVFVSLDADKTELPLEGTQRLVFGGKATPNLEISEFGIRSSLSINHVHYDLELPWQIVFAAEGLDKAFYCRRRSMPSDEDESGTEDKISKKKRSHLKVVK